jgi:outer membrane protein assembly factor BamB
MTMSPQSLFSIGLLAVALAMPVCAAEPAPPIGWTDWRGGPRRDAVSRDVPHSLPEQLHTAWTHPLTAGSMGGVAATDRYVIVSDKHRDRDAWQCLAAKTGRLVWTLEYHALDNLPSDDAPRATPVIRGDRVYLQGAVGHVHCLDLPTGRVLWRNHLQELGGQLPLWGYSATPLAVDDKLIVAPGGERTSVAALCCDTGRVVWRAAGNPAGYSSFLLTTLGGQRQVVGLDAYQIRGWDPGTGKRLWQLDPEGEDHYVVTPLVVEGKLLFADTANGLAMYAFNRDGMIRQPPVATCDEFVPPSATPIAIDGHLFGVSGDELFCFKVEDRLETCWRARDEAFRFHASIIGGNGRILLLTFSGELLLVEAAPRRYNLLARRKVVDAQHLELYAHPALVGNRLYVRAPKSLRCLLLSAPDATPTLPRDSGAVNSRS